MFTDMAKTKINNNNFNHIRNKLNSEMIYSSFLTSLRTLLMVQESHIFNTHYA